MTLTLTNGTQVMLIKNLHVQADLANSAIGTVTGFLPQLTLYTVTASFVVDSQHNSLRPHLKSKDKSSVNPGIGF